MKHFVDSLKAAALFVRVHEQNHDDQTIESPLFAFMALHGVEPGPFLGYSATEPKQDSTARIVVKKGFLRHKTLRISLGLLCAPVAGVAVFAGLAAIKGRQHDLGRILHFLAVCYPAEFLVGVPTIYLLLRRGWSSWPIYAAFGVLNAWLVAVFFTGFMAVGDSGDQWAAFLPGVLEGFQWFFRDVESLNLATLFGVSAGSTLWIVIRPDKHS